MTVSARTLERIAGLVWLGVGTMLAWRGAGRLSSTTTLGMWLAVPIGLAVGALKGRFVLSRTARRNRKRIRALEAPKVWNVFTPKFLVLIGIMIGFGTLLRWAADAGHIAHAPVAGIYLGIGAALAVSSLVLLRDEPKPMSTALPPEARCGAPPPRGLLLVNLGSPASPETTDVRRYLREFLGDPLVVEANRALWAFVLNVIILPRRAGRSAEAYRKVWTDEGSPLVVHGKRLTELVTARLGDGWNVKLAMRYGEPALRDQLEALTREGCREIRVVPLFPQWSRTTSGTIQDAVGAWVRGRRNGPAVSVAPSYPDDPGYLEALAARVRETTEASPVEHYVFSFHGIPEAYVRKGDPYVCECQTTALGLAQALGLSRDQWTLVFQSRFGDEPWLQPYADETVPALAEKYKRIAITMPAFTADCLETLEEIGLELAEDFREAGGEELVVVPALNEHPAWVEVVARLSAGPGVPAGPEVAATRPEPQRA